MPDDPADRRPLPPPSVRGWIHPSELGPSPRPPAAPPRRRRSGPLLAGAITLTVIGVVGFALLASGPRPTGRARLGEPGAMQLADRAVVTIEVRDPDGAAARASGISMGDGIVVTSAALVSTALGVRVNNAPATLVITDTTNDVAVLRTPITLAPAMLATSARMQPGDRLVVAGRSTNALGTVRALRAGPGGDLRATPHFETDIAPSAAAPGSAVIDPQGAVAGLVSSLRTSAGTLLVVPIDTVRSVVDRARRGSASSGPLGVVVSTGPGNPQVQSVVVGSPADQAGLRPGDVILAANGTPVPDAAALAAAVQSGPDAESRTLMVVRDGRRVSVAVRSSAG